MKNKKVRNYLTSVTFAFLTLVTFAQPSSAIPPEYGETVNESLNQAGQAAAGGPPVGPIEGLQKNLPVNEIPQIPVTPAVPVVPAVAPIKPNNPPAFYLPPKPLLPAYRGANTFLFAGAVGVICMNAAWGEPVAILMCATGLTGIAYKIGKEVVIYMAHAIVK